MLFIIQLLILFCSSALGHSDHLFNCDLSHHEVHYCSPNPGLARNFFFDFATATKDADLTTYWAKNETSSQDHRLINLDTNGKGAAFSIWDSQHTPSLSTQKYMFFGKISVELQAAPGQGVVSAIVLKSDSGNEISWEISGAYDNKVQANYYFHGDTDCKEYNQTFDVDSSVSTGFHTYTIEWTQNKIAFSVDGREGKTWYVGDVPPKKWPQTPMKLHLGTWIPNHHMKGHSVAKWTGAPSHWGRAPFTAFFRKVRISDFAGLCLEVDGPVEYILEERITGWQDVKVKGCYKRFTPGLYLPHPLVPISRPVETTSTSSASNGVFSIGQSKPTNEGSKTSSGFPEKTHSEAEGTAAIPWPCPPRLAVALLIVWLLLS